MTDFLATLSPKFPGNWEICKREGLWGVVGRGTNWKKNASRVEPGDRIFVWQSRHGTKPGGIIAELEALGELEVAGPGVRIPWPDPDWFGGVFPMRVVSELSEPATDSFPDSSGRVGLRFGFNNSALQHIFEEISPTVASKIAVVFSPPPPSAAPPSPAALGVSYVRSPPPSGVAPSDPFERDPDVIDRGLLAHHRTVEALAEWVRSQGFDPRLPASSDPQFDLAWQVGGTLYVAEVKSVTAANEEKQLRLGLGQVLRYRHQLDGRAATTKGWLVAEREPTDGSWKSTCAATGVSLTWPGRFPTLTTLSPP